MRRQSRHERAFHAWPPRRPTGSASRCPPRYQSGFVRFVAKVPPIPRTSPTAHGPAGNSISLSDSSVDLGRLVVQPIVFVLLLRAGWQKDYQKQGRTSVGVFDPILDPSSAAAETSAPSSRATRPTAT